MARAKPGFTCVAVYIPDEELPALKHLAVDAGASLSDLLARGALEWARARRGSTVPPALALVGRPVLPEPPPPAPRESRTPGAARSCERCGESFTPPPKGQRARFCSDKCRYAAAKGVRKQVG